MVESWLSNSRSLGSAVQILAYFNKIPVDYKIKWTQIIQRYGTLESTLTLLYAGTFVSGNKYQLKFIDDLIMSSKI